MAYTQVAASILNARRTRDIKDAVPRTQLYARLLQRKHGVTAAEMKEAVHAAFPEVAHLGFTPHNSYSLQLMAANYGFDFITIIYTEMGRLDGTRYFFRSVKNAETFDAALADQQGAAKPRTARKAKAPSVPMPIIANPQARASRKAAKSALANAALGASTTAGSTV